MTYARSFSLAGLMLLASLVYVGVASAQTTSYVPPAAYAADNSAADTIVGNTSTITGTVQGTSTATSTGSVLGETTSSPNIPNTGAGGDASATLFALLLSSLAMMGGTALLLRKSVTTRE